MIQKLISDLQNRGIQVQIKNLGVNKYAVRVEYFMFQTVIEVYGTGTKPKIALYQALNKLPLHIRKDIMNG